MNPMTDVIDDNDSGAGRAGETARTGGRAALGRLGSAAAQRREQLADERWLDELVDRADRSGVHLT